MRLWIDVVFPAVMIVFPLAFVAFVRTAEDGDRPRARRRLFGLAAATIGALAIVGILRALDAAVVRWTWTLFFPLWFALGMPACAAKQPAWFTPHLTTSPVRSASLASRREAVRPPRGILAALWALSALVVVAVAVRPVRPFGEGETLRWAIALALLLEVVLVPLLLPMLLRRIGHEPEPRDATGSPEIERAYRSLRQARASGLAWLALAIGILVGAMLIALAWVPHGDGAGATLGVVLGVGGSLVGVAGGVFGTAMTVRRGRLAARIRELDRAATASE